MDYKVLINFPDENRELLRTYAATSYAEALAMAERTYAGKADVLLGIPYDGFKVARAEGIAFNEADGLLVEGVCW